MWKGARGWADRMMLAKWLLFPTPRLIRWRYQVQHPWLTPLYYLWRPIRGVGRFLREILSRPQP
jgi:hypothetical protein